MITKTSATITNLKNLWIEMFLNKTDKVSNVADGSILNGVAFGTAKVAQKALKDISIVEAQIFPKSATGEYLDKSAALFGVSARKQALGSSTYVRVFAQPGTVYAIGTNFISKNGIRFTVDQAYTVDNSGYGYVSVRSVITGSATNVEANSITQVSPRPLTHIECTNEYAAIGGRDYEDDETFRNRIINYNNKLSDETMESWTQIFQDLDSRVLKVMNVGLGEDGKTHIYLVTQNGSFFTDEELQTLLEQATPYFGLTELNLSGEAAGIVLENAKWMYVGGEEGVDFRVELYPDTDIADARKNIQIAMTKYLDFRFWDPGKTVQWDDLLQVVKSSDGVKYVPDEYFFPYYDEEVPLNMLPRIKGFRMRDLEGNILYDSGSDLSNIFYPAADNDIYKGTQTNIISQKYLVSFTVTNTKNIPVPGAYVTIGNKVIVTDAEGHANLLLENGEYSYSLSKSNWTQQTGEFVVLNGPVYININDFTATPYEVVFTVYEGNAPMEGASINVGIYTVTTDPDGIAKVELEPGTYVYTITKAGFKTIESVLTVENQPLEIFERMFLEALTVSFAVIDRGRGVYVPEANISVVNQNEITNEEGQAEMGLEVGTYEAVVIKEGYQRKTQSITVVGEEPNCVVIEMAATPYEIKFTVLDEETETVIPNATVSINGGTYISDENGVAIISLPDGVYDYSIFKTGYMTFSDRITIDGASISKIIKLGKAYYTFRLTVRDIDTGNFIQGAQLSINGETAITNVNGVASVMLGNGTYTYNVTNPNYKRYTGTVTIKDQDVVETIYIQVRDTEIDYTVTDELTGEPIEGVSIELMDKGTMQVVSSGTTNALGQLTLAGEAGEYTWTASHKWYISVTQDITLEKLQDVQLPFTMKRKNINTEIDVTEYIPGVSGDEDTVKASGVKSVEALGNDGFYYVLRIPENILVPNSAISFDMRDLVQTFRRPEDGGLNVEYDWLLLGGARLDINIIPIPNPFATLEGTQINVAENSETKRDAAARECYIDLTVTTEVGQSTGNVKLTQQKSSSFKPVKAGLKITAKNTIDGTTKQYITDENGAFFPEVTPGVSYEFTITELGFYSNNGLFIMSWDFEGNFPVDMQITASKQLELRVKQANTLRPLEGAEIVVTGMSLDQTVSSGSDGSAKVYITPLTMGYTCTFPDHNVLTGTFTPPLTNDYIDLVLTYEQITFNLTVSNTVPYNHVAESCPVTVSSTWGGTPSQQYIFTGTTNANGVLNTLGNGTFNIPPGNYRITVGDTTGNYEVATKDIYLPTERITSIIATRRSFSITATVKEILPLISSTANPVKAGLVLACYYNENGTSSGPNVTTNASGQFTKTIYAGLPERFEVQPVVFYEGNGAVVKLNNTDAKTPILTYTCSKRIPVYVTSDQYGELTGATVVFKGMSVDQTQTTDSDGIVYMYLSPISMNYTVSAQYYDTTTLTFTPTGSETRMDITLKAQVFPVTFNVSTGGIIAPEGIIVRITNEDKSTLVYEGTTDVNGTTIIPDVFTGNYSYAVLAGEITTGTFFHPQTSTGTVIDVEVKYELINAGIQVSEIFGSNGSAYLADQTLTMTSKAGEITITLDENGYANMTLIKTLPYTFTTDAYPNFYSNPTQTYTWTEDGYIWPMNLNVSAQITFNVKDQYAGTNLQGATVTWNSQQVTTNASGNAVLYRSALTKDYSVDDNGYDTKQGTITPTTTSPVNVLLYRIKQTVTISVAEVIPGVTGSFAYNGMTINYTSAAGNGTLTLSATGTASFDAYLGIPISFAVVLHPEFYSNPTQSHTYTAAGQSFAMNLTCSAKITIKAITDIYVTDPNLGGATVTYFNQTGTAASDGTVSLYRSGLTQGLSVSNGSYFNPYSGTITAAQTSPLTVTLTRIAVTALLTVNETISGTNYPLANSKITISRPGITGSSHDLNANGQLVSGTYYLGISYTFVPTNYSNYYSNASQAHTFTASGQSWVMNLTCSANVVVNVKSNIPASTNIQGASVSYFHQTKTTDASGNATFLRSGLNQSLSSSATYFDTLSTTLTAAQSSPFNITMIRATTPIVLKVVETIPGVTGTFAYAGKTIKWTAGSSTGNITTDSSGNVSFSGILGTAITFSVTENTDFYSNPSQSFTYTSEGQSQTMSLTCAKQIVVNTKVNVPTGNVAANMSVTYFNQTKTTDASGNASFYRSGLDKSITVGDSSYINGYSGTILSTSASPFNIVLTRKTATVTLQVVERYPGATTDYSYPNRPITVSPLTSGSSVTLNANSTVSFTAYLGTPTTFTVQEAPSWYSNPTQTYTFTAANQTFKMTLNITARITFNIKSNIPSGTNLSGANVTFFGQAGVTDSSGNVSFYRGVPGREYQVSATYHTGTSGQIGSGTTGTVNVVLSRLSANVTLSVQEATLVHSGYCLEIATAASGSTSPGLGGFTYSFPTAANKEYVAYFYAKVPTGYSISFHTNAIGDSAVSRWLTGTAGTGDWGLYMYYIRTYSTGTFSSTFFFVLQGTTRPVAWQLGLATVYDITGNNFTSSTAGTIIQRACTYDKMVSRHSDYSFQNGNNNITIYNNSGGSAVTLTRKATPSNGSYNPVSVYPSKKMTFTPAASTSPLTLDTAGNVTFACYLGTPITFGVVDYRNYYSNPDNAITFTSSGQVALISLKCNNSIRVNVVSNVPASTVLPGANLVYFGQKETTTSEGYVFFYRSGLDKPLTGTATYFNPYSGTVTAAQTSPYTITMLRTTVTVTLTVNEVIGSNSYRLASTVIARTSTGGNSDLTLDGNGQKSNTVYAGLVYTYVPKNYASYYSNATQTHTWTTEGEGWTMNLTASTRITFNVKSKNYGGNLSGVTLTMLGQTGTTDSSGNISLLRSGCAVTRTYSYSKTNYVSGSAQLAAGTASPVNIILSEATSSITITIKDVYQGVIKGNTNGCPVTLTNTALSSITFSGSTNSSGQVSFGPMITGTYIVRWGGGTSYWVAGSANINMPTAASTQNASRLTKSIGSFFRIKYGSALGWWVVDSYMKPVYTTAGTATTVTLTKSASVVYLGTYTWIAGIATTVVAKVANYFVTGATTTETPYVITPTYNFSNVPVVESNAFTSVAIKTIVVTVQNSLTNAAVSGATIKMYGLNGSNVTSGNFSGAYAPQTVTTNASGQATFYVSGFTNRYQVSASKYDSLETTNANTTNFTIKLVPSEATITFNVVREDNTSLVAANCAVKLSTNKSTINYSGTTNAAGTVSIVIRPGAYYIQLGGLVTGWGSYASSGDYPVTTTYPAVWNFNLTQSVQVRAMYIGSNGWFGIGAIHTVGTTANYSKYTGIAEDYNPYWSQPSNSAAYVIHTDPNYKLSGMSASIGFANYASRRQISQYQFPVESSGLSGYIGNIDNYISVSASYLNLTKSKVIYNGTVKDYNTDGNEETYAVINTLHFASDPVGFRIITSLFVYAYKKPNTTGGYNVSRAYTGTNAFLNNEALYESFSCLNSYSATSSLIYMGANTSTISGVGGYMLGNLFWGASFVANTFSVIKVGTPANVERAYRIDLRDAPNTDIVLFKFIKVIERSDLLVAVALGIRQNATISDFKLCSIKYPRSANYMLNDSYTFFWGDMTVVETNLGANFWISPNKKWIFFVPKGTTLRYGYAKGLNSYYYNGNELVNINGFVVDSQSYMNTAQTSVLRGQAANYYIQEIIFNNSDTVTAQKMILLTHPTDGCFGALFRNTTYAEGMNPKGILYFQYSEIQDEWINLVGTVDKRGMMATYDSSLTGGLSEVYRPSLCYVSDYINGLYFSFAYPSYSNPAISGKAATSFYEFQLIW